MLTRYRESIVGVQWGQGNPNPRVHRASGKRGFAEFPTGTVDPRVGISLFRCTQMIDCISHISIKIHFTIHLARHCGLPLATYCKVRRSRSDVRCTEVFVKKTMFRSLMFPQYFKTLTSLEFRLSAAVAWQELGLQYREAVALARNVRI